MVKDNKFKVIISIILAIIFILLSGFLSVYFCYLKRYVGKEYIYEFSENDEFDISKIKTIEKKKGNDFIILNLTDIQLSDIGDFFHRKIIHDEIKYLVNEVKPDLITLTGDQTWSNENLMSLKSLIRWLDELKIPYAPVFGNHDYGNEYNSAVASNSYASDLYEKSKYCFFTRGPSNIGSMGNYVINITEEGEIVRSIYMLDCGYNDIVTDGQKSWIKWNADGIKKEIGNYPKSMIFMHKPIPEYSNAYYEYLNGNATSIGDVYVYCSLSGTRQNGLFDLAKEINVVDFVCGHQHTNAFSILYNEVRLTFALKTGELSFYFDDGNVNLNGGTKFSISKETTIIENVFVERDSFHIKGSDNIFLD